MIKDVRVDYVIYWCKDANKHIYGTNLMYTLKGRPATARLSWVATLDEAVHYIQRQRERSRFS